MEAHWTCDNPEGDSMGDNFAITSVLDSLGGVVPIGVSCGPMTEVDIDLLEIESGGKLPTLFRTLLRTCGAFTFVRDVCFPFSGIQASEALGATDDLYVAAFYGGNSTECGETNTVRWNHELCSSVIGAQYVPFADSGGHGMYVIDTSFASHGRVLYWEAGTISPYCLAMSLEEYLLLLVAR